MEELLKQVSMADYAEFRSEVMRVCEWSAQVFRSKVRGDTPLYASERIVTQMIADEINGTGNYPILHQ